MKPSFVMMDTQKHPSFFCQGTEWLQPTGRWGPLPLRTAWMCCLAQEHAVKHRTNVTQHHRSKAMAFGLFCIILDVKM
jgi:hypothetical protein